MWCGESRCCGNRGGDVTGLVRDAALSPDRMLTPACATGVPASGVGLGLNARRRLMKWCRHSAEHGRCYQNRVMRSVWFGLEKQPGLEPSPCACPHASASVALPGSSRTARLRNVSLAERSLHAGGITAVHSIAGMGLNTPAICPCLPLPERHASVARWRTSRNRESHANDLGMRFPFQVRLR